MEILPQAQRMMQREIQHEINQQRMEDLYPDLVDIFRYVRSYPAIYEKRHTKHLLTDYINSLFDRIALQLNLARPNIPATDGQSVRRRYNYWRDRFGWLQRWMNQDRDFDLGSRSTVSLMILKHGDSLQDNVNHVDGSENLDIYDRVVAILRVKEGALLRR